MATITVNYKFTPPVKGSNEIILYAYNLIGSLTQIAKVEKDKRKPKLKFRDDKTIIKVFGKRVSPKTIKKVIFEQFKNTDWKNFSAVKRDKLNVTGNPKRKLFPKLREVCG